jgi:hypothetical protein
MKDQLNEIYAQADLSATEVQQMAEYLDWNDDFYCSSAFEKLFEYFCFETREMPYGVAKARTETPDVWILEYLERLA